MKPSRGLVWVRRHAKAAVIEHADIECGHGTTPGSGLAIPVHCLVEVPRCTNAAVVHHAEVERAPRVSGLSGLAPGRLRLGKAGVLEVAQPDFDLRHGRGKADLGGQANPGAPLTHNCGKSGRGKTNALHHVPIYP